MEMKASAPAQPWRLLGGVSTISKLRCGLGRPGYVLVVYNATSAPSPTLSTDIPPLTEDLLYSWSIDTWRRIDGIMVNINSREG